ncbi:hypothetical protein BDQ17DRAFT_1342913 [Cyathus striatus]|nr:hypothetical protein BDQ17DRAFT_1342913 [Cyathus striatus]
MISLQQNTNQTDQPGALRVQSELDSAPESSDYTSYHDEPPPHTISLYGRIISLPAQMEGEVKLHLALEHTPTPIILHSLLDHPHTAIVNFHQHSHLCDWADETATFPWLSDVTIRVPDLDKPIVVNAKADHQNCHHVVTINDVLITLYHELRVEAIQRICRGNMMEVLWEDPRYAYPEQVENDIRNVITRILGGRIFWDGLSPSRHERDVWILHVR